MYQNKQRFNNFALSQLVKPIHIPDYHLMVGSAESLAPLPVTLHKKYVSPEVVAMQPDVEKLTDEELKQALEDNTYEVNDFNINLVTLGL